jgi:hypothetical protein
MGFAASEVLHRQFVLSFVPTSLIVAESSRLVQFQISGQMFGLFIASLSELLANELQGLPNPIGPVLSNDFNPLGPACSANWFMVVLWTIYLIYLVFGWWKLKELESTKKESGEYESVGECSHGDDRDDDSSDSTPSDQETGPARLFHQYSGIEEDREDNNPLLVPEVPANKIHRKADAGINTPRRQRLRLKTYAKRIRRLLSFNIAIPITLAMVVYTMFSQEVLFSSCALITNRYFHWRGSVAGFFLCSRTVLILPTDYICEHIARRYEERTTMKVRSAIIYFNLLLLDFCSLLLTPSILFTANTERTFDIRSWIISHGQLGFTLCVDSEYTHLI